MAVERNPLQVGDQVFLGGGLRALVSDLSGQLVKLSSGFGNPPGRVDDGHRRLERTTTWVPWRPLG